MAPDQTSVGPRGSAAGAVDRPGPVCDVETLRGAGVILFCLLAVVLLAGSGNAARGPSAASEPPLAAVAKARVVGISGTTTKARTHRLVRGRRPVVRS